MPIELLVTGLSYGIGGVVAYAELRGPQRVAVRPPVFQVVMLGLALGSLLLPFMIAMV